MTLNMGPQHPSTHGVLRVALELDGETVVEARPIIGYLHTGMEKQAEYKTYTQSIPQTDRMDYLAPMSNNLALCLAAEKLLGVSAPPRAQAVRVLLTELTRISAHCVWLGTHALDIGAMTVFWYCFREREKVLSIYDMVCGARMTASYFRVGGLAMDIPAGFLEKCQTFVDEMPAHVDEYERLLTKNPIWLGRTRGVAPLSAKDAIALGATGPVLRGSGVAWDLRKAQPYCSYGDFEFDVPIGSAGDTFDRYLVRVEEMRQSIRIVRQAMDGLPEGPIIARVPKVVKPPAGEAYVSIEAPKGELGYFVVSDGTAQPYRVRVRPPWFINLQALEKMAKGGLVADVVAIIGTLDIVLGEIDR